MTAKVDNEKCTGCERCLHICILLAIEIKNGKAVIDEKECADCGICVSECPENAVSL